MHVPTYQIGRLAGYLSKHGELTNQPAGWRPVRTFPRLVLLSPYPAAQGPPCPMRKQGDRRRLMAR